MKTCFRGWTQIETQLPPGVEQLPPGCSLFLESESELIEVWEELWQGEQPLLSGI